MLLQVPKSGGVWIRAAENLQQDKNSCPDMNVCLCLAALFCPPTKALWVVKCGAALHQGYMTAQAAFKSLKRLKRKAACHVAAGAQIHDYQQSQQGDLSGDKENKLSRWNTA